MKMSYDIPGRGMFHIDCKNQPGCGIMKDLNKSVKDTDGTKLHAYECLHCGEIGYYGIREGSRIIVSKSENEVAESKPKRKHAHDERGWQPK